MYKNVWINSNYNFHYTSQKGNILFNGRTGNHVIAKGDDATRLFKSLSLPGEVFDSGLVHEEEKLILIKGGFIIPKSFSELNQIKQNYWRHRELDPLTITVTTTLDCNLGCYYCYQTHPKKYLTSAKEAEVVEFTKQQLKKNSSKSLHVDWYGGEPLLNIESIDRLSIELQNLAQEYNVAYHSSIISNGTVWPLDAIDFIKRNKIRQVQLSFDGLEKNHNKRRRLLQHQANKEISNSFEELVKLVNVLVDVVHVDLRVNVDPKNVDDVDKIIDFAEDQGWFASKYPAQIMVARLDNHSEYSDFMKNFRVDFSLIDNKSYEIRERTRKGLLVGLEGESLIPKPVSLLCAALGDKSRVITPDGLVFRCGLQVSETHRAVGRLEDGNVCETEAEIWWQKYDPTENIKCKICKYLPLCMGGCPKKHLENETNMIDENYVYWSNNLEIRLLKYVDERIN